MRKGRGGREEGRWEERGEGREEEERLEDHATSVHTVFSDWVTCHILLHSPGRGQHSHAYTHSVQVSHQPHTHSLVLVWRLVPSVTQMSHHVWLNLETLKFYCLPDNYEIIDPSLEDIKVCLSSSSSTSFCYISKSPSSLLASMCCVQHSLKSM